MTQKRGLPIWISLFLKALLIMIFPLTNYGNSLIQLVILPATGFLFTPTYGYLEVTSGFSYLIYIFGVLLRNLVLGLVIAFPGMYFNYKLSQAPVNKSYWKRGLATAIGIFFLSMGILYIFLFNMFSPIENLVTEDFWMLYEGLMRYPTLVFGVFIILPLVQRQAVIIASPPFLHDYSMKDIESNPNYSVSREKLLSLLLWIFLCFAPFTFAYNPYLMWNGIPFQSLMMSYSYGYYYPIFYDAFSVSQFSFAFTISSFGMFPSLAATNIFHFIFVRDVYRYLRKAITRMRLIGIAILSSISPFFISIGLLPLNFIFPFYLMASLTPIPLLQSVGFLVVRYHHPIADQVDRIWADDEHSMWWEPKKEKRTKDEPRKSTPEKPQRHKNEEIITVPVHYMVLSKLRSFHHRKD